MIRRLIPIVFLCLLIALIVGLVWFQARLTTFDNNLYATLTAVH